MVRSAFRAFLFFLFGTQFCERDLMTRINNSKLPARALSLAVLLPLTASAASISNVTITQREFDTPTTTVVQFLGGDATIGIGEGPDQERRLGLNSVPRVFDWAYWDPSGAGDDFDFGDGNAFMYHDGRQIQWGSKFSTPSATGGEPPNGTITPVNLDQMGARWILSTGTEIAQSRQGAIRITDSGRVGLSIRPLDTGRGGSGVVDGQKFHLDMNIPSGKFLVSMFLTDSARNAPATIDFLDVPTVTIDPIPAEGDNEYALQFEVDNDSAQGQLLTFEWGDLNRNLDDLYIRFSAVVIQRIPEPTSLILGLLGIVSLGARRQR